MKRRYCTAIFFAAFALLVTSAPGYSESTGNASKSSSKNTLEPQSNPVSTYVVRPGDSLSKIARDFRTTPEALKSANRLRSTIIRVGQELRIPVAQGAARTEAPKIAKTAPASGEASISAADPQQGAQNPQGQADAQPLRLRLVKAGFEWIGVRYRRSGGSERSGFDCSGLVKSLFSKFNIELPRSSREQFKQGEKVDRDKLEAGDLVFFSSGGDLPTHVGIYVGDNKFLHAARKAQQVIVSDLNKFWHTMRYLGARRVMDLWWEEPGSSADGN
jgi:cell wall-associated NlpC family hydrolase